MRNYGELSYTDHKLGLTYDWIGWVLGAAAIGTNAHKQWYCNTPPASSGSTKQTGTSAQLLSTENQRLKAEVVKFLATVRAA